MKTYVVDASVAIKWVVSEGGTVEALALRRNAKLIAPDLLVAECSNILWKKVQRRELSREEAVFAGRLLQSADIELMPTRALLESATRMAIDLGHPAYDCIYLALAVAEQCVFVTADGTLCRKLAQRTQQELHGRLVLLAEMPA